MNHILVVDDSREIRVLVGGFINKLGFSRSEASNGLSAIEEIIRKMPDLIISDLEMPIMNGFDLLTKISNMKKSIPVIIITGKPQISSEEIKQLQRQSSFSGILEKPFLLADLKDKIDMTLQS